VQSLQIGLQAIDFPAFAPIFRASTRSYQSTARASVYRMSTCRRGLKLRKSELRAVSFEVS
jgi:hypothetical protein